MWERWDYNLIFKYQEGLSFGFTGDREAPHLERTNGTVQQVVSYFSEINYPAVVLGHEFWKHYSV